MQARAKSGLCFTVLFVLLLSSAVWAAEREWLMNQRLVGSFPEKAEGVMFLDVVGNVMIYGGMLSRNYLDDLYLWSPESKVIRNIGFGPAGKGLSSMRGLEAKTTYHIRWAAAGPKVLMVYLPALEFSLPVVRNQTWPKLAAFLYDVSAQENGWTNVAEGGVSSGEFPPEGLYGFAIASANGKFYIFGGRSQSQSYNDQLSEFDPMSMTWSIIETLDTPKVPILMLMRLPEPSWYSVQVTPKERERVDLLDLSPFASEPQHGASHSMVFHDGKLFFSNASDIYQLDLTTWRWTLDDRVVKGTVSSDDGLRYFTDGTLTSCGGELLYAVCYEGGDIIGRSLKLQVAELVPRPVDEMVTCDWVVDDGEGFYVFNDACIAPLNRVGNHNPTAACVAGQLFCSGNGGGEGESMDGDFIPKSLDVATRTTVQHPVDYVAVQTPYDYGFEDVRYGQLLTTVLEKPGAALLVHVRNPNLNTWPPRSNVSLHLTYLMGATTPGWTVVVHSGPGDVRSVVGSGSALLACAVNGNLYHTLWERLKECELEGDACREEVAAFDSLFAQATGAAAPPGCDIVAVHDADFVVFSSGKLFRGVVGDGGVSWASDGEYAEPEEASWGNGLVTCTQQYMLHWPYTDEGLKVGLLAEEMNARLFDMAAKEWVQMSDPGWFAKPGGSDQAAKKFDDIEGFDGKIYFWTHETEGIYRKFGSDKVYRYEPATDSWEDLLAQWTLPATLGDTKGGLEQPLIFWVKADDSLLMLDKQPNQEWGLPSTHFDVFRVPTSVAVSSTGNLWADLLSAFDGDTICITPATTLAFNVRFGTGSFPSRVTVSDCAAQAASRRGGRRRGSLEGVAELQVAPGALLMCYDTDGCEDVAFRSLVIACSGAPGPAALQVIGRGARLTLAEVKVQDCASTGDGGAVLVDNGRLVAAGVSFERCSAAASGGAVYARGGELDIADSEFVECAAGAGGGAVASIPLLDTVVGGRGAAFVTFDTNMSLARTSFARNAARAGGALHATSTLAVRGCEFEGNNASAETGGAAHLVECRAAVESSEFRGNAAAWGGGAVFWQSRQPAMPPAEELCAAGGNTAAWGACVGSNAQALVVAGGEVAMHTGVTLAPVAVEMRDFYGQVLSTESAANFEAVASLNFSLAADPDVQLTGTLIEKAERGAVTFANINVEARYSQWDLAQQRTQLVSQPLLYFASADPYSGAALVSSILVLATGSGAAVCPAGSILELNDVRDDGEGGRTARGRCVECPAGSYSLSPLSSPVVGASSPACFPCPAGAGEACLGGAQFNSSEAGAWRVEGAAWRLAACPEGHILVRSDLDPEQDQCVECAAPTFSRGEVRYEAGGERVAARAVDAPGRCAACPPNAECNGGTTVVPLEGFWSVDAAFTPPPAERQRRSEEQRALEMYKCPAGACEKGNQCAPGHRDRVCAICEEKHARTPAGCLKCEGDVGALKAVAGVFGSLAFLVFWYWFAWRPMLEDVSVFQMLEGAIQSALSCWFSVKDAQDDAEGKLGMVASGLGWVKTIYDKFKGDLQGFLKIIISFYQVVSSFASTFTVDWPKGLVRLFDGAKFFQLDFISLPGPACLTFDWSYSGKLVVYTVVPIIVVMLIGLPVTVAFFMARSAGGTTEFPKWDKTASLFWYSLLFFLYIIYPMVSVQCLSTFSCHDLGPAGNWLVADYRVWCPVEDSAGFLFGWSLFFTLVYPAGIPLFFAGIMYYFKIPAMAKQKLDVERLQKTIDLYRRETGSAEGASLVRHIESVATREGAEGDMMVGMRHVFETIDADGNGVLSLEELKAYMLKEGLCTEGEFKRAEPLKRTFKKHATQGRLSLEAFVDMCDQLDKTYTFFTGRDVPLNLALQEEPVSRLSRGQLELLALHPWDFTEEGGPDASRETILRNMAEGGDGRRASTEDLESEEGGGEEEAGAEEQRPMTRLELEEKVKEIAGELESLGKVLLPALGWDGALDGEQEALDRIGFLFTMYEVKFWYFELVEMVRKLLVTAVLVFVFPRTPAQLAAGLVISFGSLIIYYSCRPFLSERLDALQIFALITQCINLFYGIMLIVQQATAGTTGNSQEDGLITGIVVLLNCIIVAVPFINMAAERGISISCVAALLPCCRPAARPPPRDEEALDGNDTHQYGRFRGSSVVSGEGISLHEHRRAQERAKQQAAAPPPAGAHAARTESTEPMMEAGEDAGEDAGDSDKASVPTNLGDEDVLGGGVGLEAASHDAYPPLAVPTEIEVTLSEPVQPSSLRPRPTPAPASELPADDVWRRHDRRGLWRC